MKASFAVYAWVISALLLGCSGASWRSVDINSGYQPPRAVNVTISVAAKDSEVGKALVSALVEELNDHGIEATVVSGTSGRPEASVSIVKWNPGSRGLRWVGFGSGKGEIVVEVGGSVGVEGTADGWVKGGFFGGDAENAAIAVGQLIGETIATGRGEASKQPEEQGGEP